MLQACLVVKGYTQTYGIDYTKTFTPVAKLNIVRVLLSLAVNLNRPLQQLDIKKCVLKWEIGKSLHDNTTKLQQK